MSTSSTSNPIRQLVFGNPIVVFIGSIFMVSLVQWFGVRFMANYCHPPGLLGMVFNPINLGSPACLAVNNVQLGLANHYVALWAGAATFCIAWLISNLSGGLPK